MRPKLDRTADSGSPGRRRLRGRVSGSDLPISTMRRHLDSWVFHLSFHRRLSPRTISAYRSDLDAHLCFLEERGIGSPSEVAPDLIRESLAALHDAGRAARSRQRAACSIRAFYRWLLSEGSLKADPTAELESPRAPRTIPDVLTREDAGMLLEACGGAGPLDRRDKALIEIAYGCGLRASELVGLGVDDIDFRERWMRVRGKGGKERLLPLGRHSLDALTAYFSGPRQRMLRNRRDPGTVFLNARGGRLSRMGFWRILRKRGVMAGLRADRIHPHLLRHSYATHLLQGGASLRVVQELLGHASLTTTEIYTAVDRDYLRRIHNEYHPRG